MGKPLDSAGAGAAGTPPHQLKRDPHPRNLESFQAHGGLWWLAWQGNPELVAYGTFGSQAEAERFKARMVNRRDQIDSDRARALGRTAEVPHA